MKKKKKKKKKKTRKFFKGLQQLFAYLLTALVYVSYALHGHTFRFNIYIFIVIPLDESIFPDVLHFPMKNMSRDLVATPMGGEMSKPIQ